MCGIVAYVGKKDAVPLLVEGLKRLEYRGYDSAGVALVDAGGNLHVRRAVGRISVLEQALAASPTPPATVGMAHTRWATHGAPTEVNAHPHTDDAGRIALVHNGIIENYAALKQFLTEKGHTFASQTDTEALAMLVGDLYAELKAKSHVPDGVSLLQRAVQAALHEVEGTYGIAVVGRDEPDTLVVARKGSPLIVGVGQDEYVVASDASAIVEHTTQVIYLNDHQMAVLRPGSFRTCTTDDIQVTPTISQLEHKLEEYELGDFEHYMLKEIFEQPNAVRNCLRGRAERREGRVVLGGLSQHARDLVRARRCARPSAAGSGPTGSCTSTRSPCRTRTSAASSRSWSSPAAPRTTPGWSASTPSSAGAGCPCTSSSPRSSATATRSSAAGRW